MWGLTLVVLELTHLAINFIMLHCISGYTGTSESLFQDKNSMVSNNKNPYFCEGGTAKFFSWDQHLSSLDKTCDAKQ